jgi:hypothetical protein
MGQKKWKQFNLIIMATILAAHNLATGNISSSVVATPANVNVGWSVSGATDKKQIVKMKWMVQVGSEGYHPLKDENGRPIEKDQPGNGSNNLNVFGINAANLRIDVVVSGGAVGTLNLYTVEN